MNMQNLIEFHQFVHKTLSVNEILTITKTITVLHMYLQKLICDIPNLDLVKVYAYRLSSALHQISRDKVGLKILKK